MLRCPTSESPHASIPVPEELGRIRGRSTILLGDHSGPMLRSIAGTWLARQPGITVLPLHRQGHTGYMESPAYLVERIEASLLP